MAVYYAATVGKNARVVAAAIALVAAAALAGCSATATPAPTTTPAGPSVAAHQPAVPAIRVPTTCAALTTPGGVSSALGVTVGAPQTLTASGAESPHGATSPGIVSAAFAQTGSLDCTWSAGTAAPFQGLKIDIRPENPKGWAADAATSGGTEVTGWGIGAYEFCGAPQPPSIPAVCHYSVLTTTEWVGVSFFVASPTAQFTAATKNLARAIVAVVQNLPAPSAPWVAPASSMAGPATCADIIPDGNTIGSFRDLQLQSPTKAQDYDMGIGTQGADLDLDGGIACDWTSPDQTDSLLSVLVLPGADWAWTRLAPTFGGTPALKAVAGIGQQAFTGCDGDQCETNILQGGYWIELQTVHGGSELPVAKRVVAAFH
jgi:hypothetical protein